MAKGSRFMEKMIHGIPQVGGSTTPDGRTVGELHRARRAEGKYHHESLTLQRETVKALTTIHGGKAEVPNQGAREAFHGLIHGIDGLSATQQQTLGVLQNIESISAQNSAMVEESLSAIRGPAPEGTLSIPDERAFLNAINLYMNGQLKEQGNSQLEAAIAKIISSQTAEFQIPNDPSIQEAVSQLNSPQYILSDPHGACGTIDALYEYAVAHDDQQLLKFVLGIDKVIGLLQQAQNTPISDDFLIDLTNRSLLADPLRNRVMELYPQARKDPSLASINYNLSDLLQSSKTAEDQRGTLILQGEDSAEKQTKMLRFTEAGVGMQAQSLVFDASADQDRKRALEYHAEAAQARRGMLAQGEMANYRMDCILKELNYVGGEITNLGEVVEEFGELAHESLMQLDDSVREGFAGITTEMVLTRMAVLKELKNLRQTNLSVGMALQSAIMHGNTLLEKLVAMVSESHATEAAQYFREGMRCIDTAGNITHIEEAHAIFLKGINAETTVAENHFGTAFTAELLEKWEKAKEHYDKAAIRASTGQFEMASLAYEGVARIEADQGNIQSALGAVKEAIRADGNNYSARYLKVKLFTQLGREDATLTDGAIEEICALIIEEESHYFQMKINGIFDHMNAEQKEKCYASIWQENSTGRNILRSPRALMQLLQDLMEDKNSLAPEIYLYLLRINPQILINRRFWEHPSFESLKPSIESKLDDFINKIAFRFQSEHCYRLVMLMILTETQTDIWLAILRIGFERESLIRKKNFDGAKSIIYSKFEDIAGEQFEHIWFTIEQNAPTDIQWLFNN